MNKIHSNSHLLSYSVNLSVWVSPCKYLCQGEKGETGKPGRDGSAGVKVLYIRSAFQMEVFSFWIHTLVSLHKTSVITLGVQMSFVCLIFGWTKQNDQNYTDQTSQLYFDHTTVQIVSICYLPSSSSSLSLLCHSLL